ncbi:hypothetical protein HZH66_008630 [Vespula vulgaris]|uniref:Secreted protein n=1 Tax=Vespula vulgaris TaxID=7454 RepID=A0A834JR61_VESVU|nr:hypothetical protein HZH66_008630 [Vespula vulgaris]
MILTLSVLTVQIIAQSAAISNDVSITLGVYIERDLALQRAIIKIAFSLRFLLTKGYCELVNVSNIKLSKLMLVSNIIHV